MAIIDHWQGELVHKILYFFEFQLFSSVIFYHFLFTLQFNFSIKSVIKVLLSLPLSSFIELTTGNNM